MGADNRVIAVVPSFEEFQRICVTLAADEVVVQHASCLLGAVLAHVHAQMATPAEPLLEGGASGGARLNSRAIPRQVLARGPVILYDTDSSEYGSSHDFQEWREVLRQFLEVNPGARVVFVSRLADEDMWIEVLKTGGHDLLSKPFSETDLRQTVRRALLPDSKILIAAA